MATKDNCYGTVSRDTINKAGTKSAYSGVHFQEIQKQTKPICGSRDFKKRLSFREMSNPEDGGRVWSNGN